MQQFKYYFFMYLLIWYIFNFLLIFRIIHVSEKMDIKQYSFVLIFLVLVSFTKESLQLVNKSLSYDEKNSPKPSRCKDSVKSYDEVQFKDTGCRKGWIMLSKEACINPEYQRYVPPKDIVTVYNRIHQHKIVNIQEKENKITLDIEMEQSWEDPRIFINFQYLFEDKGNIRLEWDKVLDSKEHPIIWNPWYHDLHIRDVASLKSHHGGMEYSLTSISLMYQHTETRNITGIRMTMDFLVTIYCHFEYLYYPFDTERCAFRLITSPYKALKMKLFSPSKLYHHQSKVYQAFGFDIRTTLYDDDSTPKNNSQSQIGLDIMMKRMYQSFLWQYYLPCCLIIVISQMGYVIPLTCVHGRVTLGVTQFLALINLYIFQQVLFHMIENNHLA